MSNLMQILNKGTKSDIHSLIESMSHRDILDICLNSANYNILYNKHRSYLFYEDDMEEEPNCILDILLECKDLTKSKHCILAIFKIDEISQTIARCDDLRRVSIYDRLIKCDLISDEDIIIICGNCSTFVTKEDYDDGDIYYTYTELTNIFKYILENRPQYAKYLVTIDSTEFSFWYYHLLEDKNAHSEMFKELLISNIYEFNRIQAQNYTIEGAIIVYDCNILHICYFDTILLIMEVIQKYSTSKAQDINHFIFISLKVLLCGVLPPAIYDIVFINKFGKMRRNIYFILAFCYLNMFEGVDIEQVKDFCQSISSVIFQCNIDSAIQAAIEYSPNTTHLKKYI